MTLTVAVLKGGRSLERGVSLRSGAQVQDALQRLGHDTTVIDVGPGLIAELRTAKPDVAFIALHGREGEDGTVQELMETIGLPYTGSAPLACGRCSDKILAKQLLRAEQIPTPDFCFFSETSFKGLGAGEALSDIAKRLGFPLVVKPASQGSALGIKLASSSDEIPGALVSAFSYDRRVLLERHVRGADLAVSILESSEDGEPQALPIVQASPRDQDFYGFDARYEIGRTEFVCPADLPEEIAERARRLALATYKLLGCHGFARVDLMLDETTQELFVLETNVVPGLTETSLLPQAADAAGIGFDELIGEILASASSRTT